MTNPFEDADGLYVVLVNNEKQRSLWPSWLKHPSGWEKVFGPDIRNDCLSHIEKTWLDMRPDSLVVKSPDI